MAKGFKANYNLILNVLQNELSAAIQKKDPMSKILFIQMQIEYIKEQVGSESPSYTTS